MTPAKRPSHPYLAVWKAVRRIPKGRVSTYGTIAGVAGLPRQARLVGYALHNLPEGAEVPWQRVVNALGRISARPGANARKQRTLLEREGVRFDGDAIPLTKYGWPKDAFG